MQSRAYLVVHTLRYVDAMVIAVICGLVWKWHNPANMLETLVLSGVVPISASLLRHYGLYESHRVEGVTQLVRSLLSAQIAALAGFLLVTAAAGLTDRLADLTEIFLISSGVLLSYRLLVYGALRSARAGGLDLRQVCVVGEGGDLGYLQTKFASNPSWGLRLAYWLHAPAEGRVQSEMTLKVDDFLTQTTAESSFTELLRGNPVDEVLVWAQADRLQDYRPVLTACREYGLSARVVLRDSRFLFENHVAPDAESFAGEIALSPGGRTGISFGPVAKRLIDIVGSACLILLLAPLLLTISLLVKLSSRGPVLFIQPRLGRNGRIFGIWKFRTMVDGAEVLLPALAARNITEGVTFKSRDDWRVTPAGRWLRRFSLDELPQLFNVLHGTMSLVGPRPLPVREAIQISGPYRRRFSVRPGITCLWQVNGRSDITFGRWMSMDLEYVDGWSLWLDAKLLARTIPAVLSGRGSY